ncbi:MULTISPECIES: caspase family protein [unclassified Shinella]|uniref:caspase family protein n=1 Tax=unclassified Shinella TaxID=2643062 RepID=UPI00225C7AE5|nr:MULTISPECIES: caspase family protein [unclassified Shinella]MCO5138327.1 caspase family protein [Shinella sp.]MDC7255164.1 caspase family protein [Shinella sp. YE25]CAI0337926.1 putative enzyme [Rhizobiaceae bacterium]CAK7256393.1 metacaspase-1 [Shinella sp. WSC3-e]
MIRYAAALLLSLCLVSGAKAADRALLIGIGTYATLPEKMFLEGPKNDVPLIEKLLKEKQGFAPESIRVLRDKDATRAAILASIDEWLIAGTQPGDRVYFYFSGHGLQVKDQNGDEEDGLDEALSTFDIAAGDGDWTNVILDDEIDAMLAKLKDRAVSIVIDACHSGTISRSLSPKVGEVLESARFLPRPFAKPVEAVKTRGLRIDVAVVDKPEIAKQNGVEAWSAASSYQVAWDDTRLPPDERHGVFTLSYVNGHEIAAGDSNGNGIVSNAELLEYVKKQSQTYCAAQTQCQSLDPQLEVNYALLGASAVTPTADATAQQYQQPQTGGDTQQQTPDYGKVEEVKVENTQQTAYVAADPVDAVGDILGKAETGDVKVALSSDSLKNGDVFRITVTSNTGGHLILYDVDKEGKATQIFPNEAAQKITPLSANTPLTIPDDYYGFDFEAEGPSENVLVAIVIADDVDLTKVAPNDYGLTKELDARTTIADIAGTLQQTWTRDTENRSVNWSLGLLKYAVY